MAVEVRFVAVHKVKKEQQKKAEAVKYRETLLPIENSEENTTFRFVDEFSRIYKNRRKTSRTFGEFETNQETYPVSKYISRYLASEINFLILSKNIADWFRMKITDIPMATGGYVFCIDYSDNEEPCIAIVILTNKSGTSISDETLDLLSSFTLNVDEINMAVNIKTEKWRNNETSYLSFIRGRKDIAQYFRSFIGCKQTESNFAVTKLVIDNVFSFIESIYSDEELKTNKENVARSLYALMKNNSEALSIDTVACSLFPEEVLREQFTVYLEEKNVEIPYDFVPDGRAYRRLVKLLYKTKLMDIKIDQSAFQEGVAYFDPETDYLVIKDPLIKERYDEIF
ncbi:MAG: nucleoid-associated protein [Sphaerochaetaceae bacterium]|nr:nucleoid-associated protein [Sphaerochaetaceae bacterium]